VLISLVSVLNLLCFYISTFRSMCAVPNIIIIIIIITTNVICCNNNNNNLCTIYLYYTNEHNYIIIITTNVIRYLPNGPCHTAYSEVTMEELYHGQGLGENYLMHAKVKTVFRWKTRVPPT